MKKLFLLVFLFAALFSKAQNYQPLNSNSFQVFFQISSYYSFDSQIEHNMWGTRIDSTALSMDGDSIFLNYPIARDTAIERDANNVYNERCVWIPAPNWSGSKTIISASGNSWFFNGFGDSILLKYSALTDSSWIAFTYEDRSLLKATVENIFWIDDIWTQDSVKIISFQHIDSIGNSIADNMNGKTIELYQNHGFRKTFDFVKFPFDTISILQLDINYINSNSPYIRTPQVGDITSTSTYCEDLGGWPHHWGGATSKKVLEIIPYPTEDSIQIHYLINTNTYDEYIDYSTTPPHVVSTSQSNSNEPYTNFHVNPIVSFTSIIIGYDNENLMPREHLAGFFYTQASPSCPYPKIGTFGCVGLVYIDTTTNDDCVFGQIPFECNQGTNATFTPYIGWTYNAWWSVNDGGDFSCNTDASYIKRGDSICGDYWFVYVGIEDYEQLTSEIIIYPNPASNSISIQPPSNFQYSFVKIVNAFGQEVYQSSNSNQQSTLDISSFSSGIYFISLSNGEQSVTKKFVKE